MRRWRLDREKGLMLPLGAHGATVRGDGTRTWVSALTYAILCQDGVDIAGGYDTGVGFYEDCAPDQQTGGAMSNTALPGGGGTLIAYFETLNAAGAEYTRIFSTGGLATLYPMVISLQAGIFGTDIWPPDTASDTLWEWATPYIDASSDLTIRWRPR